MGLKLNIIVLVVTIVVTLSTTSLMCISVVTDYWEIVSYPITNIEKILNTSRTTEKDKEHQETMEDDLRDLSIQSLHQGKVILVQEGSDIKQLMVQMHSGLWSICYDVAGDHNFFSL